MTPEVPPRLPTLRRELIGAIALVFAGALFVAATGIVVVVPLLDPFSAGLWIIVLLLADIVVFSWLGTWMLQRRLLAPLDELVACVEDIAEGEYETTLPVADTRELARLSSAVSRMADRLLSDRRTLADNIRSLDETNRLLTEARDAMIHSEKMASVGRLGAGIAHEVGNPLGAILGYIGLLTRQADDRSRELLTAAEREARRIDRIVRGLLDYSRPRDAVVQAVDVALVLADTIDLVRTQGRFSTVVLETGDPADPGTMLVRGDQYQLQQVLVNLLVNAADAVGEGQQGVVRVNLERRLVVPPPGRQPARRRGDPEGVDYSHRRRLASPARWRTGDPESDSGEVVEVSVADNGPGISPDMADQIFEPFVTTKEPGKGTGLGLAVCARLVEGMGGSIHASTAPEGGAVFRVVLPAITAPAGVAAES